MTTQWYVDQQQLALHAIHIFPRLSDLSPVDFLIRYDKMNREELSLVSSLLNEPVKCWTLMKFDYTLIKIVQLLRICGRSRESLKLVSEAQSRTSETLGDGTFNPIHLLLYYTEISCCGNLYHVLPNISETFQSLGSPSWAVKAQNLYALQLESDSWLHKAVHVWELILDQSRNETGSIFVHPTWMLFCNLKHRIRHNVERRQQLLEKFETDASSERTKVRQAAWILDDLRRMRLLQKLEA
jgi:hypothetical protein